jgi:hypothetical protein
MGDVLMRSVWPCSLREVMFVKVRPLPRQPPAFSEERPSIELQPQFMRISISVPLLSKPACMNARSHNASLGSPLFSSSPRPNMSRTNCPTSSFTPMQSYDSPSGPLAAAAKLSTAGSSDKTLIVQLGPSLEMIRIAFRQVIVNVLRRCWEVSGAE